MLGGDIIREVSLDLNDQEPGYEYTRWTRDQLQTYLREALFEVSSRFKSWFLQTVTVRVEPGAGWQKACDCSEIVRLLGEADSSGRILNFLSKQADDVDLVWSGAPDPCAANARYYRMRRYSISSTDDAYFRVYPPVPAGLTRYVLVECFKRPDGDMHDDVPDTAVAMVKQWMLYRALSVDSENNTTITQLATTHKDTFFKLAEAALELQLLEERRNGSLREVQKQTD